MTFCDSSIISCNDTETNPGYYSVLKDSDKYCSEKSDVSFIFNDLSQLYHNSVSEKITDPYSKVVADETVQPYSNLTTFGDDWLHYSYPLVQPVPEAFEGWSRDPSCYADCAPVSRDMYYGQDIHDQDYVRVDHTYRDYSCVAPSEEDRKRFLNKKREYEKKNCRVKKEKVSSGQDEIDKENKEHKGRSRSKGGKEDYDDIAYGFMGTNFPARLHDLLTFDEGISDIITWLPHGRAWIVLKKPEFVAKVAPSHFSISKFESFTRQVNGWGFKRITQGPDINAYYHEMFLRGMPHLIQWMKRNSTTLQGRRKMRADPRDEPNFYQISSLYPLPDYYSILCGEESSTKSFQVGDSKEYGACKSDDMDTTAETLQDPKNGDVNQKKTDWKKKNLRVVTSEDLASDEEVKRITQDEGAFRVSPKSASEVQIDSNFHDLEPKDELKETSIQDALELWAREQTFSFATEVDMDREGGVTDTCMNIMNSPHDTSSRFKCVINHPLALTPLCGPRNHWNDESCDFMPLPYDYGSMNQPKMKEVSKSLSDNTTTSMLSGPPVYYYTDQELYLCNLDGQNRYVQQNFSKDSSLLGYYGPYYASECMGSDGASQDDPTNSMSMTYV